MDDISSIKINSNTYSLKSKYQNINFTYMNGFRNTDSGHDFVGRIGDLFLVSLDFYVPAISADQWYTVAEISEYDAMGLNASIFRSLGYKASESGRWWRDILIDPATHSIKAYLSPADSSTIIIIQGFSNYTY